MKKLLKLMMLLLIFNSCKSDEEIDNVQNDLLKDAATYFNINQSKIKFTSIDSQDVVIIENDMVYSIDTLKELLYPENDAQLKQRNDNCTRGSISLPLPSGKLGITWRANGTDYIYLIHYRISSSVPALWQQATRDSFDLWNSLPSNRIRFEEVPCGALINSNGIYVSLDSWTPTNQIARATLGTHYNFKQIWINQSSSVYTSNNLASYTRVMVHEIGHNLGYRHTDQNSGCLISGTGVDNLSIMRSTLQPNSVPVFSAGDITAHNTIYGNVADPVEVCLRFARGCSGNTGSSCL